MNYLKWFRRHGMFTGHVVLTLALMLGSAAWHEPVLLAFAVFSAYVAGTLFNAEVICDECFESLEEPRKPAEETGTGIHAHAEKLMNDGTISTPHDQFYRP